MNQYSIRPPQSSERAAWEKLWDAYIEFYESTMSEAASEVLWQRIQDENHPIRCRVAENRESGELVAMVQYFPHVSTWGINPVCYLNDLYVNPDIRGGGLGEALIQTVVDDARENAWDEVYWLTQSHNRVARGLYDKLTGGTDGFLPYRIELNH